MTEDKTDFLIKLSEDYFDEQIQERKKLHQEFIADMEFLRQKYEIEKVNPHNHRITLVHREHGRKIFYPYNNYMFDDIVIRILDELTYPEAVRRSKQEPTDKVVDEQCET